jgi:hypothetical protein
MGEWDPDEEKTARAGEGRGDPGKATSTPGSFRRWLPGSWSRKSRSASLLLPVHLEQNFQLVHGTVRWGTATASAEVRLAGELIAFM